MLLLRARMLLLRARRLMVSGSPCPVEQDKLEAARRTKDETKCVSLGTSKINYNDPRITIAWCKAHEVPIQKQFPKTLLAKFAWAMNTDPEYRF